MQLWRICRQTHATGAFSGEGARLYGGRWNSPGVGVIYTSPSLALAAIETFVHLEPDLQPDDLVSIRGEVPEDVTVQQIELRSLPMDWYAANHESLRVIGDRWASAGKTLALRVPSAAIRGEWNMLLNPTHAEFGKIRIRRPVRFEFDRRMFRAR